MFVDSQESQPTNRRIMWRPLLFTIALPLLAACFYPWLGPSVTPIIFFAGLLLAFSGVTGIWLGVAKPWWRCLVAPFVITLAAYSLGSLNEYEFNWVGALIPAATSIIVWITLEITKLFFGQFAIPGDDEPTKDGLQFGISQLLITTTVLAIFISCMKYVVKKSTIGTLSVTSDTYWIILVYIAILVLITLASVWALLGASIKHKLFIASLISLGACVAVPFLVGSITVWHVSVMFVICWIAIKIQLWLLRVEGIRFVRR